MTSTITSKRVRKSNFPLFLKNILEQVSPDCKITIKARDLLGSLLNELIINIYQSSIELSAKIDKCTLTSDDIVFSLEMILNGELRKKVIAEVKEHIFESHRNSKTGSEYKFKRHIIKISKVKSILKTISKYRSLKSTSMSIVVACDFISLKILKSAYTLTSLENRKTITDKDIMTTIMDNKEFSNFETYLVIQNNQENREEESDEDEESGDEESDEEESGEDEESGEEIK